MGKEQKEAYDRVSPESLGNNKYKITVSKMRELLQDKNTKVLKVARDIGNYDEMYEEIGHIELK